MTFIYPYKPGLRSVRNLRQYPGIKAIKRTNSKYRPRPSNVIVNWGSRSMPDEYRLRSWVVLNRPECVGRASNKLSFFQDMQEDGVNTVPWTEDIRTAIAWRDEGHRVMARTNLRGHSGDGIVVVHPVEPEASPRLIPPAPLYTRYVKSRQEWRVHVFCDDVLFTQRKVRNLDVPPDEANWWVRSHHNGFVFQRNNETEPDGLHDIAVETLQACGLDFGAVDILWNEREDRLYVLEVNTAPNLEVSSVEAYAVKLQELSG